MILPLLATAHQSKSGVLDQVRPVRLSLLGLWNWDQDRSQSGAGTNYGYLRAEEAVFHQVFIDEEPTLKGGKKETDVQREV